MMILEAKRLGLCVVTLDADPACPSHSVSDEHITADFYDENAIRNLAEKVDVITYEYEHIHAEALARLEKEGNTVYPSAISLLSIQDKFLQKTKLSEHGINVPAFEAVNDIKQLREYAGKQGYPFFLKSRKEGYDGKGTFAVYDESDLGYNTLGGGRLALMTEEFMDYTMEVSVIAARGINGEKAIYPIPRNEHANSILDTSTIPSGLPAELEQRIVQTAGMVMDVLDGVGIFGVEMFICGDDIYINEVAPRPHNSGHYTIEGCRVNQFENHIRAITGLPLGCTKPVHSAVIMRNLLGKSGGKTVVKGLDEAYTYPGVNLHNYGKAESKPGRKMGHYTITAGSLKEAADIDAKIKKIVMITGEEGQL
jgi:5-(carboxyamino)imidazole ribonucleotide synthase